MQLSCSVFRISLPLILFSLSGGVTAVGLGELRGQPALGERLQLSIVLLGADKQALDATCFRLIQPSGAGDLPWLKKATMSIRKSTPPVLEIRSDILLREPIMQLAVQMTCGVEVSREYVLLASPLNDALSVVAASRPEREIQRAPVQITPRTVRPPRAPVEPIEMQPRLKPQRVEKRAAAVRLPDRLTVAGGSNVGEPSLRLATEILSWRGGAAEAKEPQREILRLEFRMLSALHEQVTTQMATAEKLRNMETTLIELQQRTTDFAQRVEKTGSGAGPITTDASTQKIELPVNQPTSPTVATPAARSSPAVSPPHVASAESASWLSEWSLYGGILGAILGVAGWLGWQKYRARQQVLVMSEDEFPFESPEMEVDPQRNDEREEFGGVDLSVEPSAMGMPMRVDLQLDGGEDSHAREVVVPVEPSPVAHDSLMSISAATVDEHFEANPVMELADIMLSFGRVKGAAQALQEYIDNNPQEALQPWIRLMDVYRMAGMRSEFESVAANLNQNFNVEVQHWEAAPSASDDQMVDLVLDEIAPLPVAPRPQSLEDMPRIMAMVCEIWSTGDVVGYLYQLLRDNRGGKRVGFALPVVEEILFLVELKETSNRVE